MNKNSDSSEDESINGNNTKEKGVQVDDSVNKNEVKSETLIDIYTEAGYQYSQEFDKDKYLNAIKVKELLNKTLTPEKNLKQSTRRGSRSDPTVQHVSLESITKKREAKIVLKFKMDIDKWSSIIPVCVGSKNVAEFINTCEIAIKEVGKTDLPLLIKIINSKLAGNALEACKYRETDSWESIKAILQGAFEHRVSERALTIGLSCARMAPGEGVAKFAS